MQIITLLSCKFEELFYFKKRVVRCSLNIVRRNNNVVLLPYKFFFLCLFSVSFAR